MNQSVNRSICRVQYPSGVDDWQTGQEGPAALWPRSDGGGGRGGQTDDGPGGAAGPHLGWGAARAGSGHPRELLRHGRVSSWLFYHVSYSHLETGLCLWFTGFLVVDIHESFFDMGGWVAGCSVKHRALTYKQVCVCDLLFFGVTCHISFSYILCAEVLHLLEVDIHESFFNTGWCFSFAVRLKGWHWSLAYLCSNRSLPTPLPSLTLSSTASVFFSDASHMNWSDVLLLYLLVVCSYVAESTHLCS